MVLHMALELKLQPAAPQTWLAELLRARAHDGPVSIDFDGGTLHYKDHPREVALLFGITGICGMGGTQRITLVNGKVVLHQLCAVATSGGMRMTRMDFSFVAGPKGQLPSNPTCFTCARMPFLELENCNFRCEWRGDARTRARHGAVSILFSGTASHGPISVTARNCTFSGGEALVSALNRASFDFYNCTFDHAPTDTPSPGVSVRKPHAVTHAYSGILGVVVAVLSELPCTRHKSGWCEFAVVRKGDGGRKVPTQLVACMGQLQQCAHGTTDSRQLAE